MSLSAQTPQEKYEEFRKAAVQDYSSFRKQCNKDYIEFLKSAWDWYEGKTSVATPLEPNPVPPTPYVESNPHEEDKKPIIEHTPVVIAPIQEEKQPLPIEPIYEVPTPDNDTFITDFYGVSCKVRLPNKAKNLITNLSANELTKGWEMLSSSALDNTIRDCLENRIRYGLSDWAYLQMLDKISRQFCKDANSATLLMAYLFSQSGYQMRLANDNGKLCLLFGSKHRIYNHPYFVVDNINFYPYSEVSERINICQGSFQGERPLSLTIPGNQEIGSHLSELRKIQSEKYSNLIGISQVYEEVIDFYNTFPTSELDGNFMTRWAMYANTPLSQKTKEILYPSLLKTIENDSKRIAADKLLNWVQTGFVYEYDDKVWGHDRAFFAEESLYYPYCDCEDRSILFSRLIRDLLGLEVALVYYPGHLATAVCFDEEVQGDAMIINGKRFTVCDPTYIGAPVGVQMPNLDYSKATSIVLKNNH